MPKIVWPSSPWRACTRPRDLDGVAWEEGKEKIAFLPAQTMRFTKLASDIASVKRHLFLVFFTIFPLFLLSLYFS
jgi:hypothetical protein